MDSKNALQVQLKKMHHAAIVPKFQTEGAAGFDLHAVVGDAADSSVVIPPGESRRIGTAVAVSINDRDWGLFLFPRSGLGAKGIRLGNCVGVIDSDYQGELLIILRNDSAEPFTVKNGDRIAQGVFMPVRQAVFVEVEDFTAKTERGEKGFGSTGVSA